MGSAQAVSQKVNIGDAQINSHRVAISARLTRADTGEAKVSESSKAVKAHVNRLVGIQLAVREACESSVNALAERIVSIFQEQCCNVASIKLLLYGLNNYDQLQEVNKLLTANIREMRDILQRNYTTGTAELEIELAGSSESLTLDLTSRRFRRYAFTINEMTSNQLQVILISKNS